jgi:dolichyl-phosphate beta-glucosyltransferase
MDISIIIPAFNEQFKIRRDIAETDRFLSQVKLSAEIIVVDDGSFDKTSQIAQNTAVSRSIKLHVMRYEPHRGKGYAVRYGILNSVAEYVMFMDSGGNVPHRYILKGLELLKNNICDIAMGSRRLAASIIHKDLIWYRRITSALFRKISRTYLKIPPALTDTQCGFKMYRGTIARKLYGQCTSEGFLFDVEIILRAAKLGYRMKEIPIEWTCDRDSRLSFAYTPAILRELKLIKRIMRK